MAKKGSQYTTSSKRFAIPADYKALDGAGVPLISAVRTWVASINRKTK